MPSGSTSCEDDLNKYLLEVKGSSETDVIAFWANREQVYTKLVKIALDLVAAPASEAFVERIFSLCGELIKG